MAVTTRGNMRYIVEVNGEPYASFIEMNEARDYSQKYVGLMTQSLSGFGVESVVIVDILNDSVEFSMER